MLVEEHPEPSYIYLTSMNIFAHILSPAKLPEDTLHSTDFITLSVRENQRCRRKSRRGGKPTLKRYSHTHQNEQNDNQRQRHLEISLCRGVL